MGGKRSSNLWNFFDKISSTQSKCKHCGSKVNIKAGNTSTMKKHLKMHAVEYAKFEEMEKKSTPSTTTPRPRSNSTPAGQPTLKEFSLSRSKYGATYIFTKK